MIHVYAVARADAPAPARTGVDGAPVQVLVEGGLAALYSRHAGAPGAPSAETALAHAGVCDDLVDRGVDVLPVRYGTRYADEQALRAGIAERGAWLHDRLEHVRGHVELGVRVLWDVADVDADERPPLGQAPDGGAGRAYLMQRVAQEQRRRAHREVAERAADRVHAPLAAAATDARTEILATPRLLLTAAYLVPRADVPAFRDHVERLAGALPDLEILCTGPWPPYSFVEGRAESRSTP